jgi:hypothetical protein
MKRRLFPRALGAVVAAFALLAMAAPAMAGSPAGTLDWGPCADSDATAAGWQCATFKAPKDYGNPGAGFVKIAVTRLQAQDRRIASARCSSTTAVRRHGVDTTQGSAPTSSAPSTTGSTSSLRPARRRPELALDRLRRQPGDGGPLLEAVHHAREPRRQGAVREGQGLRQALRGSEQGHPALRLDRQRRA